MTDVLNSYLLQNNHIQIPGFGSIYIQIKPVTTDFVNKQLFPSSFSYRFDKHNDTPDEELYSYLAYKKGILESQAVELYNEFVSHLRSQVKSEGYFEWQGVGVFKQDANGEILFEEQRQALPLAPVPAKRVIRKDSQHAILVGDKEKTNVQMSEMLNEEELVVVKKDRWWIYAIILFAIGLIAIFIHFYQNGFKWNSAGNQQRIELHQP
jgi:nucleoid DNA-binding protein